MKKNEPPKNSIQLTILTLFPELIESYLGDALLAKAIKQKRLKVKVVPLREFAEGRYKSIDDIPYGGGDGMVFKASIIETALQSLGNDPRKVIYLSPQGKTWNASRAKSWVQETKEIVLICGRYGGIDQRFIQKHVDEEISIGDYVLSGGELAALVVIESLSRFVPGVLGHADSATHDSFENHWLEAPQFTKPQKWEDQAIPEVLASGNHAKIDEWKKFVSWLVTLKKRPDLFVANFRKESSAQRKKSLQALNEFYEKIPATEKMVLQIEDLDLQNLPRLLEESP
jgi:tRNA (guanine37-N1)-methyltransferase